MSNLKVYPSFIKICSIDEVTNIINKYSFVSYPYHQIEYGNCFLAQGYFDYLKRETIKMYNKKIKYPKEIGFKEIITDEGYHNMCRDYYYIGQKFYTNYVDLGQFLPEKYQNMIIDLKFLVYLGNYVINNMNSKEQFLKHIELTKKESLIPSKNILYISHDDVVSLHEQYKSQVNVKPKRKRIMEKNPKKIYIR